MSRPTDPAEPTRWRRAAYGLGDLGFNLYWSTVSFYILYFYTDVLGLSGKVAGLIFLVAMLWDAVTDPVIGILAQRTRSRWGSYRPYILFGAVPLALSLVLVFLDPGLEGAALVVFALASHMVFRTAYTVVNIPYSALSARITRSTEIRNELAAWRIALATIGTSFVAYSTLKLVGHFGDGDEPFGFVVTMSLFAGISLPVFLILFASVREGEMPAIGTSRPDFWGAFSSLGRNKPFLVILGATIFATLGGVLVSKLLVYYFKYTLGDETAVGLVFAANSIVILFSAPLWAYVTSKTSKRFVWRAGALVSITASLLLYANQRETIPVVVAIAALSSVGSAAAYLTFWSAIPDTVEYGEMRCRRRDESLTFGVMSFVQKSSYGVAAALAGVFIDLIGYQANAQQGQATLDALKFGMTLLPAGLVFVAFLIIGGYRLDSPTYERVLRILEARKTSSSTKKDTAEAVP
ncbi:MFS transporter [Erythrobacter sp. AP23]|uniref:MFS transporter n=1 Tax=Erythrobacter sp. AP23 TaxID=499656 RepID=UPI00076DD834|nr:MFS transporter [Erythrobacter sp. AP23]KWV93887.1 hypothetical protein ASS64_13430 [Erythrobacter sp. AP23]